MNHSPSSLTNLHVKSKLKGKLSTFNVYHYVGMFNFDRFIFFQEVTFLIDTLRLLNLQRNIGKNIIMCVQICIYRSLLHKCI